MFAHVDPRLASSGLDEAHEAELDRALADPARRPRARVEQLGSLCKTAGLATAVGSASYRLYNPGDWAYGLHSLKYVGDKLAEFEAQGVPDASEFSGTASRGTESAGTAAATTPATDATASTPPTDVAHLLRELKALHDEGNPHWPRVRNEAQSARRSTLESSG